MAQKENQPDKLEKRKRFEKKCKVMQKKEEDLNREIVKTIKPKIKKRSNKNWTRAYEDGLIEDEYDYL